MNKRYVICGFLFDKQDAEDLLDTLRGKMASPEIHEFDGDDRFIRLSDVKWVAQELMKAKVQ